MSLPRTLAAHLLSEGIPLTLLMDLVDPEGMRQALAAELLENDVALAPAPSLPERLGEVRTA